MRVFPRSYGDNVPLLQSRCNEEFRFDAWLKREGVWCLGASGVPVDSIGFSKFFGWLFRYCQGIGNGTWVQKERLPFIIPRSSSNVLPAVAVQCLQYVLGLCLLRLMHLQGHDATSLSDMKPRTYQPSQATTRVLAFPYMNLGLTLAPIPLFSSLSHVLGKVQQTGQDVGRG